MKFGLREIVFVLLLMGIPLAAWWFVFRPRNAQSAEMLKQIEAKQAKLQALNRATATIGDLKNEIASLAKAIAFFESKLPSEKEIEKVLEEVWSLAEDSNLTTKSIRTLEKRNNKGFAPAGGPHAEQAISMKLEGDFMGLYKFMLALESQPRIMRVRKMSVKKPLKAAKAPEGAVSAELELSVFFEKGQEGRT